MPDALMNTEELARLLNVPIGTIRDWRLRGTGPPGLKVGRHVRYRVVDVERWLDDQLDGTRR